MTSKKQKLTSKKIDEFERIKNQIQKLHQDISALSKRSPDGPINKFKLGFINEVLTQANDFLPDKFRPSRNFELFDEDNLPTNSDVVMILSQYLDALEGWRSANVKKVGFAEFEWVTTDGSTITAKSPTRYRSNG